MVRTIVLDLDRVGLTVANRERLRGEARVDHCPVLRQRGVQPVYGVIARINGLHRDGGLLGGRDCIDVPTPD